MNKISDLSIGTIILFIFIFMFLFSSFSSDTDPLDELDADRDGIVTRHELKNYLIKQKNNETSISAAKIKKQVVGGALRGFFMGLIFMDIEGGITLSIVLGILNPLVSLFENKI